MTTPTDVPPAAKAPASEAPAAPPVIPAEAPVAPHPMTPIEIYQSLLPHFANMHTGLSDLYSCSTPAEDPKSFGAVPTINYEQLQQACQGYNTIQDGIAKEHKPALDAAMASLNFNAAHIPPVALYQQRVAHGKTSALLSAIDIKEVGSLAALREAMAKRMEILKPTPEEVAARQSADIAALVESNRQMAQALAEATAQLKAKAATKSEDPKADDKTKTTTPTSKGLGQGFKDNFKAYGRNLLRVITFGLYKGEKPAAPTPAPAPNPFEPSVK